MTTHFKNNKTLKLRTTLLGALAFLLILNPTLSSYKISVLNNNDLRDRFPTGVDNVQIVQGNTNDVKDKTFEILGFDTGEITGCKKFTEGIQFLILI